ncbi:FAD-dependent oxidoreductase [Aurantiacibacter sediminis]|uniref:FAD-dependent oxidoreductase n=1 Tax=Aurantiacibacter sediminis TaxID=2793064 RepID=A0ABS0N3R8_9SPHN|nr:FAD-dependent oxidoreductase [Aurantiacibacter sediminis]MBH5322377.1 FAD-dependent oxidoreductase [Aurantiacibacter sediminis]
MRHIAIIGSGPAGYYTAEALQKKLGENVRVDVFDMLPVPYGLIRTGVAPDHQSIKAVSLRYEKTALTDNVRFVGNIAVGRDISVDELRELYDAVVLATGAPQDRQLGLPGEDLGNVFGSAAFVGWYNGHPQFADLDPDLSGDTAVVIGMGNVALDVARMLAKTTEELSGSDLVAHARQALRQSKIERIVILGRRGPHQIMMTPKELGELGELHRAAPHVDPDDLPDIGEDAMLEPGLRKSVNLIREYAAIPEHIRAEQPIAIEFAFFSQPKALSGDGTVSKFAIEETRLEKGRAVGTGKTRTISASMVISCIGYRSVPIPGVPFDERAGRFHNDDGRILPGLYCVGWARRGPSGTIGTNKPDGFGIADHIVSDIETGVLGRGQKTGRKGFDALAAKRDLDPVTFQDWKKIEEAELAAAQADAPREKFVDIEAMIRAAN